MVLQRLMRIKPIGIYMLKGDDKDCRALATSALKGLEKEF